MTARPYPWFGNTMSRWETVPIVHVARLGTGHTPSRSHEEYWENCTIPWVTVDDIRTHGELSLEPLQTTGQHISELGLANSAAVLHPKGTVMLSRTASIGFVCIIGRDMATTQAFVTWTPNPDVLSGDYLNAALKAMSDQYFYLAYGATHLTIYFPDIKTLRIPLPPLDEQRRIAAFLKSETSKIDALVVEQRRFMELLKEKRQAVISHAVTKGLDPNAKMKDSGIEWLGEVPEHWRVCKLGHASKLQGGFAFSAADFGSDGVAVVRMNNLRRGRLDLSDAARIPESACNPGVALSPGDLVWGMSGSTGETGSLGNYARVRDGDLPCQLNQRVGRFVADQSRVNLDFIEQMIRTPYFYEQIMLLATGTAQFNVSPEQVQSCVVALPPLSEQAEIVERITREASRFDTLNAEAQRAIDLLQERRTALISAAVTGQIDVRGVGGGTMVGVEAGA